MPSSDTQHPGELPPYTDPIDWFARWFEEARAQIPDNPDAMAVATVGADGRPSLRQVLLKDFGPHGFVFHTNYHSRKARELEAHPQVALDLYWRGLERQVRIEGDARRLDPALSDAYFASRSRNSQIGAWASLQSETLPSREAFEERIAHFEQKYSDQPVPRPEHWGGYLVVAHSIEFWQAAAFRLHTRWLYERDTPQSPWRARQLFP